MSLDVMLGKPVQHPETVAFLPPDKDEPDVDQRIKQLLALIAQRGDRGIRRPPTTGRMITEQSLLGG